MVTISNLSKANNDPLSSMHFELPKCIQFLMHELEKEGFEVYLVGGAVRDFLLRREIHDYDLCTSASPAEMLKIFQAYPLVRAGEKHGTIAVILDNQAYEITTFRKDGQYEDHRRPEHVEFTRSLEEDVKRRDFTINALAYHPQEGFIDYVDGIGDLDKKVIRAVGNPNVRFQEDALRILRAYRFASQFLFTMEEETRKAAQQHFSDLQYIATERIYVEMKKMMQSAYFVEVWPLSMEILQVIVPEWSLDTSLAESLKTLPHDFLLRFIFLSYGLDTPIVKNIVDRLRFSKQESKYVLALHEAATIWPEKDPYNLLSFLERYSISFVDWVLMKQAIEVRNPEKREQDLAAYIAIQDRCQKKNMPATAKDLAINGDDLLAIGIPQGKQIATILDSLWQLVLIEKLENTKAALLASARTLYSS